VSSEFVREATIDGRVVANLRCYDDADDGGTVVEAQIHPKEGTPVSRGYRFSTAPDAFRFVQETLLALQYLGCAVA
jgi:hypothetical protein